MYIKSQKTSSPIYALYSNQNIQWSEAYPLVQKVQIAYVHQKRWLCVAKNIVFPPLILSSTTALRFVDREIDIVQAAIDCASPQSNSALVHLVCELKIKFQIKCCLQNSTSIFGDHLTKSRETSGQICLLILQKRIS